MLAITTTNLFVLTHKFIRPDRRHSELPISKRQAVRLNSIAFYLAKPEGLFVGVSPQNHSSS